MASENDSKPKNDGKYGYDVTLNEGYNVPLYIIPRPPVDISCW